VGEFAEALNHRLAVLSRVQAFEAKTDKQTTVDEIIKSELEAIGPGSSGDHTTIDGPSVPLDVKSVQTLTLAIHELATNAVKYGALASPSGRLSVRWDLARRHPGERNHLRLHWIEFGVQYPQGHNNTRKGFGRQLIETALPAQLQAKTFFNFDTDGLRCTIEIPLP
jgi:two-component sensor histidine kinase